MYVHIYTHTQHLNEKWDAPTIETRYFKNGCKAHTTALLTAIELGKNNSDAESLQPCAVGEGSYEYFLFDETGLKVIGSGKIVVTREVME